MRKLLSGILEFRASRRADYAATFEKLATGQRPDALFVTCSDSRVAANVFASTEPGDVFVLRNVGNLIPPCERNGKAPEMSAAAAVEFSVQVLGVRDIIICGHSHCGAMHALCHGSVPPGAPNIGGWLKFAEPALQRHRNGERLDADLPAEDQLSQLNVLAQLDHLRTYPGVSSALATGRVSLHGWWFNIAHAEVEAYDAERNRFVPIDEEVARKMAGDLPG